jgi:glycosyltransferase involved in cell wall biosynthesis
VKALVITGLSPSIHPEDKAGIDKRFERFLVALGGIAGELRVAYIASPEAIKNYDERVAKELSNLAGKPVSVTLIERRAGRSTSWKHYVAGIVDTAEQPQVQIYCGPAQADAVTALIERDAPDLVFVHRLPAMLALLKSRIRGAKIFFDLDDVEDRFLYRRIVDPPVSAGKLAYLMHMPALMRSERKAIALSDLTFVCSNNDKKYLSRFADAKKICVVPNTVDVPDVPPGVVSARTILYVGTFRYPPNVDAAERLITDIFPMIRSAVGDARLLIAGIGNENIPSRRSNPANVEFLGFVPDLDALYRQSRVVCCPLLVGGGTRIKLIEAAAHARPMVSTHLGAEGLEFRDEKEILLRDSDGDIAMACIRLLTNDSDAARLGSAARHRMLEYYRPEDVAQHIERSIRSRL